MKNKRLFLLGLISITCIIFANANEMTEALEEINTVDVKDLLMLPYDAKFDSPRLMILDDLEAIVNKIIGIGRFVIVSPIEKEESRLLFEVSSEDLTLFSVSIYMPESCQSACEMIFFDKVLTASSNQVISNLLPKYDSKAYSLLDTMRTDKYYLCIERGFLFHIGVVRQQPLQSPVNKETLIAQVNTLMDNLIALFEEKNLVIDNQREYYEWLKAEYTAINENNKQLPGLREIPDSATRINLRLLELPKDESTKINFISDDQTNKRNNTDNIYLIDRSDGEALPLVKIVDPNIFAMSNIAPTNDRVRPDGISDILFQVTSQEKPTYFEIVLRSDGQYQVHLYGTGNQMVRVLYLNKDGEVVEFGEIEVNVTPSSE